MKASADRHLRRPDALVVWEEGSFECCWSLWLLQRRPTAAVVSALCQGLVVVSVSTVAKRTVCVVIVGSARRLLPLETVVGKPQRGTYQLLKQASHHRQIRGDWRLKAATASAPRLVAMAVTAAVVAGTDTRPAVGVRCREWARRWSTPGTHEAAVAGNRPTAVVAGTHRAPVRYRVPCWQDALPWRRFKSRGTAEAA